MEAQLQELIEQIKSEGVATAKQEAQHIVQEAEKQAAAIISDAEAKAEAIRLHTEQEIARKQQGSESALIQASRDLLLATRLQLETFFQGLLEKQTEECFSGKSLAELIFSSIKGFFEEGAAGELHLDEERYQSIEDLLRSGLEDSVVDELSVFPGGPHRPSFSLVMKDGAVYVDVSTKELAELLKPYVNRYLGGVLDRALSEESAVSSSNNQNQTTEQA